MILSIRTEKPETELALYNGAKEVARVQWEAHRALAETIHIQLKSLLQNNSKEMKDIKGIVVYKGPGSFTGLRIGMSVANALGYSLNVPVCGATGEDWINEALNELASQNGFTKSAMPKYGAEPHITKAKK